MGDAASGRQARGREAVVLIDGESFGGRPGIEAPAARARLDT